MGVYNISKIESWYNEFSSLRNNYVNNYYKNYNNSYIKRCNDSNVAKMRNKLNAHYEKIKKLYDGINKYWREYLNDVKNTDNRLAGKGGGINAASLASKLNSMPRLKEYNDGSYTIVMKTNNFFNKYSYNIESILDSFKNEVETGAIFTRSAATLTVFTASCAEGIIKLVEMAADGVVILGAIAVTKYALYADIYNHIVGKESNYTKELWDKTRAHVSKDYTKMAFDLFYDNTDAGNWLKNNAYEFDTVRAIGCEVGEVVGVVALSMVTGGSAAAIYGAAKGVEHTEENWQDSETSTFAGLVKGGLQGAADGAFFALGAKGDQVMKNVAKNAIEQGGKTALKKVGILTGKMGFEVGCSLVQDCSNIFINAYFKEGNLGDNLKYYYDQAGGSKQLLISASTAMILSGISDAVDLKKIGDSSEVEKIIKNISDLDDATNKTKISASNTNLGANNYYSPNDRILSNYARKISINDMSEMEIRNAFSNMDKVMVNIEAKYPGQSIMRLKRYLETGNINVITSSGGSRTYVNSFDTDFVAYYLKNRHNVDINISSSGNYIVNNSTLNKSDVNNLYNFFHKSGNLYNSTYGVNQGCISSLCDYYLNGQKYSYREAMNIVNDAKKNGNAIPRFIKRANSYEYETLKEKLVSKGLTRSQASVILSSVDDVGACSYAAKANSIFYEFANNPELFQEKFGFQMYKLDGNGEVILNSSELLLDMYMYANDTSNGGKLFSKNFDNSYTFYVDDRVDVFGRKMLDTENQAYMSNFDGSNNEILSKYMKSKGLEWRSYNLITNYGNNISNEEFGHYLYFINSSINNGYAIQLGIGSHYGNINMYSTHPEAYPSLSTRDWVTKELNINGEIVESNVGHDVFVTAMDNEGFFVSSWGQEYKILFDDLQNGGFFNIAIDNVDVY